MRAGGYRTSVNLAANSGSETGEFLPQRPYSSQYPSQPAPTSPVKASYPSSHPPYVPEMTPGPPSPTGRGTPLASRNLFLLLKEEEMILGIDKREEREGAE